MAPFSWLLARDVEQGRAALNFSTWDEDDGEADDAADAVADAEMPPRRYVLAHPDAALSEAGARSWSRPWRRWTGIAGAATAAAPAAVGAEAGQEGLELVRTRPSGWPAPGTGWRGGGRRRRR